MLERAPGVVAKATTRNEVFIMKENRGRRFKCRYSEKEQ
jgi:hypothetical protein